MAQSIKQEGLTASKGNKKLHKSVLIWNLPSVKTCPNYVNCKDKCYARRAEKLYPSVLPCRMKNWQASKQSDFVNNMIALIKKSKCSLVRVHESGDFYSQTYADKWSEIAANLPEVQFFAYTKSPYRPSAPNFNIVESILPSGEVNFTDNTKRLYQWAKTYKAKVCPYGLSKKDFTCGKECKACVTNKYVVFKKH